MSKRKFAMLRGAIHAKYGTQEAFADAMGMRISTLSAKLNGRSEWTKSQIKLACELLEISLEEVYLYFFAD